MFICVPLGDVKVVLNEGMPHYKNIDINGRLIIEFKVLHVELVCLELAMYNMPITFVFSNCVAADILYLKPSLMPGILSRCYNLN